mmetsp:Transcript_105880/g.306265  ORF Transcript_105880/g.306265 Transcript_105880/m.306265 type:complete len:144 (-) Transcript_105880:270-701(-)
MSLLGALLFALLAALLDKTRGRPGDGLCGGLAALLDDIAGVGGRLRRRARGAWAIGDEDDDDDDEYPNSPVRTASASGTYCSDSRFRTARIVHELAPEFLSSEGLAKVEAPLHYLLSYLDAMNQIQTQSLQELDPSCTVAQTR